MDPDSLNQILIQGFSYQKCKKYSWFFFSFWTKITKIAKNASMKDVQAGGEAFNLKRKHRPLRKMKFINFFYIFLGHFCPLGSGYGSRDPIESGSTTLEKSICVQILYALLNPQRAANSLHAFSPAPSPSASLSDSSGRAASSPFFFLSPKDKNYKLIIIQSTTSPSRTED